MCRCLEQAADVYRQLVAEGMVGQVAGRRATIWAVVRIGIVAAFALKAWLPRGITVRGARLIEEIRTYGRRQVLLAMLISVVASARQFNVFASITRISAERDALGDDRGHEIELLRSSTEASGFRHGNESAHRGDRIHSSRFTKTDHSTSSFFRWIGATRFAAVPTSLRIGECLN